MGNTLVVRKIIEKLAREMQDWNLKSSNMHSSDADLYVGFKFGDEQETANESEYDPKTGEVLKNDTIGTRATYLHQWDSDEEGYLEEYEPRDNGVGYQKLAADQINPIK